MVSATGYRRISGVAMDEQLFWLAIRRALQLAMPAIRNNQLRRAASMIVAAIEQRYTQQPQNH